MDEGQPTECAHLLTTRRARGVHSLMTRLLGRCTCKRGEREVRKLYGIAGAHSDTSAEEQVSA